MKVLKFDVVITDGPNYFGLYFGLYLVDLLKSIALAAALLLCPFWVGWHAQAFHRGGLHFLCISNIYFTRP